MDYRNPMCKHYREEANRLLDHTEAIKKKYIDKQPTNSTSLSSMLRTRFLIGRIIKS